MPPDRFGEADVCRISIIKACNNLARVLKDPGANAEQEKEALLRFCGAMNSTANLVRAVLPAIGITDPYDDGAYQAGMAISELLKGNVIPKEVRGQLLECCSSFKNNLG